MMTWTALLYVLTLLSPSDDSGRHIAPAEPSLQTESNSAAEEVPSLSVAMEAVPKQTLAYLPIALQLSVRNDSGRAVAMDRMEYFLFESFENEQARVVEGLGNRTILFWPGEYMEDHVLDGGQSVSVTMQLGHPGRPGAMNDPRLWRYGKHTLTLVADQALNEDNVRSYDLAELLSGRALGHTPAFAGSAVVVVMEPVGRAKNVAEALRVLTPKNNPALVIPREKTVALWPLARGTAYAPYVAFLYPTDHPDRRARLLESLDSADDPHTRDLVRVALLGDAYVQWKAVSEGQRSSPSVDLVSGPHGVQAVFDEEMETDYGRRRKQAVEPTLRELIRLGEARMRRLQ